VHVLLIRLFYVRGPRDPGNQMESTLIARVVNQVKAEESADHEFCDQTFVKIKTPPVRQQKLSFIIIG